VKGQAWLFLFATSFGLGTPLTGQTQDTRTTLDGVYTAEQAARGGQTYQRVCSESHSLDYYSGATRTKWVRRSHANTFDANADECATWR
jgi:hypothetical protein